MRWLLFLISLALFSQNKSVVGIFPTLDVSVPLAKKWNSGIYYFLASPVMNLSHEPRHSPSPDILLFYGEHWANYSLTGRLDVSMAYVFQRENVLNDYPIEENRFHFQVLFHLLRNISLRLRQDIRFITHNPTEVKNSFKQRTRFLTGYKFNLNEKSFLSMYQEFFINLPEKSKPYYAENWAYFGHAWRVTDFTTIENGLLYITWKINSAGWFHQLYYQFTFKKNF
jgi:hypothetical protein